MAAGATGWPLGAFQGALRAFWWRHGVGTSSVFALLSRLYSFCDAKSGNPEAPNGCLCLRLWAHEPWLGAPEAREAWLNAPKAWLVA